MLRILTVNLFCYIFLLYGESAKVPTNTEISIQKNIIDKVLREGEKMEKEKNFQKKFRLEQENILTLDLKNIAPGFKNLEKFENLQTKEKLDVEKLLQEAQKFSSDKAFLSYVPPLIFVSFSQPKMELKALLSQAKKIGSILIIRGLVKNSFRETISAIKDLGEVQNPINAGIVIDPTLFAKFGIAQVPSFVLPLENLGKCIEANCKTIKHIKAFGSVSLSYFLSLVASQASNEIAKKQALFWLAKIEKTI